FLLRRVPVLVVLGQVDFRLALLGLGLLQAEDVRLVGRDEFLEGAFLDDGADAVDVPRVEFHARIVSMSGARIRTVTRIPSQLASSTGRECRRLAFWRRHAAAAIRAN